MPEKKKKLTEAERKKIGEQIADLQAALEEEEEASTAAEQAAAEEALAEERRRTAELFDKLDLTEEDFDLLVASVSSASDSEVRRIVREELDSSGGSEEEDGKLKKLEENPTAPPVKKDTPPEPGPGSAHWTDKKLFGGKEA